MMIEPLRVPDAWQVTTQAHSDDRGSLLEWFREDLLANAVGRRVAVVQANHSISARGVVRGVHFADVPPGQAKYVYCTEGAVIDIVVDVRVGSPTFGVHDSVRLDDVDRRAVLISEGLGHAFCALTESAHVVYLMTTPYDPSREYAVSPLDPDLALPWADYVDTPLLSDRDKEAPTLEAAHRGRRLPTYTACRAHYDAVRIR